MKNNLFKGLALVIALLIVTRLVVSSPVSNVYADAANGQQRKISVNGQGTVKVKPDVAYVTLGVQTDSIDAKEAQSKNTTLMNSVIDAVKALGVDEKDIRTSGYYMYPQYNYEKEQKIIGYTVTNSITVTVRNIEKAGDIIDASIAAGGNMTSNIQFNVSDPMPYYQQALTAAIGNAKIKGTAIANTLGVEIDLPLEVIEQSSYYAPTSYGNMRSEAAYDSAAGTPIQTGELEISATVQLIYGY